MGWAESLQKAINYMENHLLEDISIKDVAQQANSSTYHFQRTFAILTDTTVGEYIRRRRLTLAAQEISITNEKIIDIALKYGYDTPEAFAKAFRKQHGITPSDARRGIGKLQSFNRLVIQVSLKGAEPMNYRIVETESFQVVGIKREFSFENGENLVGIPKLWNQVNSDGTDDQLYQLNNGPVKGVLGICIDKSDINPKHMDYWVAAAYEGKVPEGYISTEIPTSKWAVFEVRGAMPEAMQRVWEQIISEWFPSSGYKHAGTAELEVYPPENAYSDDYYSEIWIPIK